MSLRLTVASKTRRAFHGAKEVAVVNNRSCSNSLHLLKAAS
jgi:hypothetical protein